MSKELETLAQELKVAKSEENRAKAIRIAAEEAILAVVGCKEDGSETHDTESFKVTTKGGLRYSCDMKALAALDIMPTLRPVKVEEKFDPKGYKWLRDNDAEVFKKVAAVVTVKPAKPSVTIKTKEI